MSFLDILFPMMCGIIGLIILNLPKRPFVFFCRLGKAFWRLVTFGLTDMRWFFPEERVWLLRSMAIAMCLFLGIASGIRSWFSLHGPNGFAAVRQARAYLEALYSSDPDWLYCQQQPGTGGREVTIHYESGVQGGDLRGVWDGTKYTFTESK